MGRIIFTVPSRVVGSTRTSIVEPEAGQGGLRKTLTCVWMWAPASLAIAVWGKPVSENS